MKRERRRIWYCLLFAAVFTVLVFVSVGGAATYTVCSRGCDYTSIQAAVTAARPGDTIVVHSGTYYENVNVNKQLVLKGKDTGGGKPVVDAGGRGNAITLSHDGIVLDGFTAINAGGYPQAGIAVTSNYNTILNNLASNNELGIYLPSSSKNTLTNNTANSNKVYGILLLSSSNNNKLTSNKASNNRDENAPWYWACGIQLKNGCNDNTLTGNTVSSNTYGLVLADSSNNNTLTDNIANSNRYYGIFLCYSSTNNTLTGNTAVNHKEFALSTGIHLDSSSYNNLVGNTASNNGRGIYLALSSYNALTGNTVSNNQNGIHLWTASTNTLTDNTASQNNKGIWLYSSSNNNILKGNTATTNSYHGICLESSNNNQIYNNYFENTNNAFDDGTNIWNIPKTQGMNIVGGSWLGGNYWSNYAGTDTNGDGLGDTLLPYNSLGYIANGGDCLPLIMAVGGGVLCGDVNCDGEIDVCDVGLLQYHVGFPGDPRCAICTDWAADVNGDGKIDVGDVGLLLYHVGFPGDQRYALKCCS
ncbi:MAG TPA: hypothetical protein ENN68_03895 [Methanomicrobia archaeon]|nr:hypothetical protein [Methanomicrobia archaeon]